MSDTKGVNMSMSNEQIAIEIAVIKSQMTTILTSTSRIETVLEKFSSLDKTLSELVAHKNYTENRLVNVERETATCAMAHHVETEKLWGEYGKLKDLIATAIGMAKAALYFVGGATVVIGSFLAFLFNTAIDNKSINIKQTQQIEQLQDQLAKSPYKANIP